MMRPVAMAVGFALSATTFAAGPDFGQQVEQLAREQSVKLFGTAGTLAASSTASISAAAANANPTALVQLAPGLSAQVVSAASNLGPNVDMMVLWPNDSATTHIIACNEQGSGQVGLQRISLADGSVANIVAGGLTSCDPAEITPWGTIVFAEEAGTSGRVFELINPLETTDVAIAADGSTSGGTNPGNIVWRSALGKLSFEGISVYPNGIVYYGDENRPGSGVGGGAFSSSFRLSCIRAARSRPWISRRSPAAACSDCASARARGIPISARATRPVAAYGWRSSMV